MCLNHLHSLFSLSLSLSLSLLLSNKDKVTLPFFPISSSPSSGLTFWSAGQTLPCPKVHNMVVPAPIKLTSPPISLSLSPSLLFLSTLSLFYFQHDEKSLGWSLLTAADMGERVVVVDTSFLFCFF